ncbi:MAG: penicillin-binding protein 2 [Actinomycetota bacterium]|nr:penicillin-binding protein 2 [Actinomycetota bacterium]
MSSQALVRRRSRAVRALVATIFGLFTLRLVWVQVLGHAGYAAAARSELTRTVTVPAVRGGIYDRNGSILAVSVIRKTVVADPYLITKPAVVAAELAPILGTSAAALRSELTLPSGFVYLAHRVSDQVAAKVAALNINGINLIDEAQRVSPDGQLAEPVIGVVGAAGTGLSGLEYQYQDLLAGKAGTETYLAAPDGVVLSAVHGGGGAPVPGTGLELTIDQSLQYVAERALGAEIVAAHASGGTAIVEDVHTGQILAMANLVATPTGAAAKASQGSGVTTPSTQSTANVPTAQQPAAVAPTAPFLPAGVQEAPSNTAVTQVYEPGSVFKLVTFSASLTDGIITPQQDISVPPSLPMGKYTFHDAEVHGQETLTATQVLAQSSNIGTIEITQKLGAQRLFDQIHHLGFGSPTGLQFPGESQGLIPPLSTWTLTSIGSTPIGQADAVTAQQLLDAYNSVANGGIFVQPSLVRATVSDTGAVKRVPPAPSHRVISSRVDAELIPMFEQVVKTGTGVEAAVDGYTVAGKTGTAQIPDPTHLGYIPGAFYGTFAGFAPAENPVLSAVVILQHPTPIYGGAVAAPVFSEIMQYALHHYGVPTTTAATAQIAPAAIGGAGSIKVTPGVTTEGP